MKRPIRELLAQERKSDVILTESEIRAEEAVMLEGLEPDHERDLNAYNAEERKRRRERQELYDKQQI